ncbi:MAG: choice-of-anchor tandem repeat GloVer-containing protein [Candidatus Korobacteraceae bacterium]
MTATRSVQAQIYAVLHNFTGRADGSALYDGVTMDQAGNLYGTTSGGGNGIGQSGNGTVFRLSPAGASWVLAVLYTFQGGHDGGTPQSGVVFGPDGALYGTTSAGGGNGCGGSGCGTVFRLTPPATPCVAVLCPWAETVLYRFQGGTDGATPAYGDIVFDQSGSIYGTTIYGGNGPGTVYRLSDSGGSWTENVLYAFPGDEGYPFGGVVFNQSGNLYGTTFGNDGGMGTVYEMSPSGSSWIYRTLYSFTNEGDGYQPTGGVTLDQQGNLYGTTTAGGPYGGGTIYELIPSQGNWTFTLLQGLQSYAIPWDSPTLDNEGNVYGTSAFTGGPGDVFKLTPSSGKWSFDILHTFAGSDGYLPFGNVIVDANGGVYGTTFSGGSGGGGVVWEITP